MSRRRRRFHHGGVYFADTSGLRAAQIDAGQLTLCLEALLGERGLLDVELVPARGVGSRRPEPAVSVRDALAALRSAVGVFSDCASVVERVWQGQEQVGVMLDAAEASDNEAEVSRWLLGYELVSRIADDHSPVRRDALTLARATLRVRAPAPAERARERGSRGKGNRSGGGSGGKGEVGSGAGSGA